MSNQTTKKQLTPGEILELVRGLKDLGVLRGKFGDLEFEFQMALPSYTAEEPSIVHLTPEEYEEKAKKIRKELENEVFAAS